MCFKIFISFSLLLILSDEEQKEEQEADFMKEFSKIDPSIPLVCVCGNHDIGNTPTRQSIQHFKDKYVSQFAMISLSLL